MVDGWILPVTSYKYSPSKVKMDTVIVFVMMILAAIVWVTRRQPTDLSKLLKRAKDNQDLVLIISGITTLIGYWWGKHLSPEGFQNQPSKTEHLTTNTRVPTTNTRNPTTNTRNPTTNIRNPTTNTRVPTTNIRNSSRPTPRQRRIESMTNVPQPQPVAGCQPSSQPSSGNKGGLTVRKDGTNSGDELRLYYASWCGPSRNFIANGWNPFIAISQKYPSLRIVEYLCEGDGEQMCNAARIRGYPTVHLVTGPNRDQIHTLQQHQLPRTKQGLQALVEMNR